MEHKELYNRYVKLLSEKIRETKNINTIAEGYISEKNILNKKYYYLQKRIGGKLKSEYIKANKLESIRRQLVKRTKLTAKIAELNDSLSKIETASFILNEDLYHRILLLKYSAEMDMLSAENRKKVLNFTDAMTALEGLPVSKETHSSLEQWSEGKQNFLDGYMQTLTKYNMNEV